MLIHSPFGRLGALTGILLLFLLQGCATTPRYPESILDSPDLHVSNGYKLLKKDRWEDAEREFERAVRRRPDFSVAYSGMALVRVCRKDYGSAFKLLEKARVLATSPEEKVALHLAWIRLHTARGGEGWVEEAEKHYFHALALAKDAPELYYYMGLAYKMGYRLAHAKQALQKVVEIRRTFVAEAEADLAVIEKIDASKPVSAFGKGLSVQNRITRAEAAGLFVHELGIREFYARDVQWQSETRPAARKDKSLLSRITPQDIVNHPLFTEIEEILAMGISGMSLYGDGTFGPDEYVTRAGFATMVASVAARILKDPARSTQRTEGFSPFKDVRSDASYFGSILVCRELGGLDASLEIFNPMGAVAGYDAVFMIRKIKDRLHLP